MMAVSEAALWAVESRHRRHPVSEASPRAAERELQKIVRSRRPPETAMVRAVRPETLWATAMVAAEKAAAAATEDIGAQSENGRRVRTRPTRPRPHDQSR
jgi:hypothetical protein